MLVMDWLSLINAIGNFMQLLFSSVTKSKQRQFWKISVCLPVILEDTSVLRYLKDADKKVRYLELMAMNTVFRYYLSGEDRLGPLNLL